VKEREKKLEGKEANKELWVDSKEMKKGEKGEGKKGKK